MRVSWRWLPLVAILLSILASPTPVSAHVLHGCPPPHHWWWW